MGASTLGEDSSSQYIRSTSFFKWYFSDEAIVIQMCVMIAGPESSSSVSVSPGAILRKSSLPPVRS
jgi:hypothetical protein